MATGTITPSVGAPAAAPAAPAAPSTPAVSTPTPATPAVPVAQPESTGDSGMDRIREGWAKVKGTVGVEEEPAEEEPAAAPVPAEAAPVEEPAVEEPATEESAAAEQPETPVVAAAEELPELDDGSTLDPKAFAQAVKADPAVEKFFNEHPEIKGQVFQALRERNETREIRQLIPDVETARTVTQAAATYQGIDNKFLAGTTKDGAKGFLDTWAKEALIVDDQGNPKMDAQGKYQFHPALTNILNTIAENKLDVLFEQAERTGNERLKTAVEIIREVSSPSSPGLDEIPEEMKPYADSVKQREQAVTEKEQASARAEQERTRVANEQSIDRAESGAADSVQRQLEPSFTKAGLSKAESEWALNKIGELVDAKLEAHPLYQSIVDSILQREPGEAREKAHRTHLLKFTNQFLGPIAAQVIREAKAGTLDRQTARSSKVAAQTAASRSEPRGTTVNVPSAQAKSPAELRSSIINEYKTAHNGEEPEREYVFAEVLKRQRAGVRA